MNKKALVTIGKWAVEISFIKPYQKETLWCHSSYNFRLFTVNITDSYGLLVILNIKIRWDKIYKPTAYPGGGLP
jgi:hypothetical protein